MAALVFMAEIFVVQADKNPLERPQQNNGHDGDYRYPYQKVYPYRRFKRYLQRQGEDNSNRAEDHDNKHCPAVAGIVWCQIEVAMGAGLANF